MNHFPHKSIKTIKNVYPKHTKSFTELICIFEYFGDAQHDANNCERTRQTNSKLIPFNYHNKLALTICASLNVCVCVPSINNEWEARFAFLFTDIIEGEYMRLTIYIGSAFEFVNVVHSVYGEDPKLCCAWTRLRAKSHSEFNLNIWRYILGG